MIKELSVIAIPLILIVINPISINAAKQVKNPVANDQYIPTNTNTTVKIILTGSEIKK
jgi:hypothetical protein